MVHCSLAGHRVNPWTNGHFYSATKFAISALRDGIRNELREINSHIRVTVCIFYIISLWLLFYIISLWLLFYITFLYFIVIVIFYYFIMIVILYYFIMRGCRGHARL